MLDVIKTIFELQNILMMFLGVTVGVIIGALPGLSTIMAIVVILPLTYGMDSITGMYLLLGAYCGGTFGGSITAILINTPGTMASAATTLDGYPMARNGRAADALKTALISSVIGGIFSCLALLFFAPIIAGVAIKFGPAEFFALTIYGLTMVAGVSGKNLSKGIITACLGVGLSTVGIDPIEGVPRMMFGQMDLLAGIKLVAVMLGIFALSECLVRATEKEQHRDKNIKVGKATIRLWDILKHWKNLLVSSLIGLYVGAVPGTGSAIGAYMSYDVAKNMSKHPEEFGKGSIEGVIAPETGNNATTGSALIPMLTLGIPGSAAVAVLMGALTMQNITPGPELFTKDTFWVYSIMLGLVVINLVLLIQGKLLTGLLVKVSDLPYKVLIPGIMTLCMLGAFSIRNSFFDITLMLIFTTLGYILKYFKFPIPPMAIGFVLGKLAESNFRRALVMSDGNLDIFVKRPISLGILILTVIMVGWPYYKAWYKKLKVKAA